MRMSYAECRSPRHQAISPPTNSPPSEVTSAHGLKNEEYTSFGSELVGGEIPWWRGITTGISTYPLLEVLFFVEGGRPEDLEKKTVEQGREATTNSTHIKMNESIPDHIGERRGFSPAVPSLHASPIPCVVIIIIIIIIIIVIVVVVVVVVVMTWSSLPLRS
ncbi:hypothetical protein ACROYT_G017749 [Oculina patagonica]